MWLCPMTDILSYFFDSPPPTLNGLFVAGVRPRATGSELKNLTPLQDSKSKASKRPSPAESLRLFLRVLQCLHYYITEKGFIKTAVVALSNASSLQLATAAADFTPSALHPKGIKKFTIGRLVRVSK